MRPAFDRQWTRSVAVINGSGLLGIEDGEDVLSHDRSLLSGGGRGLGVRRGTNVAEREDIRKPRVPKRLMVAASGLDRTKSGAVWGGQT